MGFGDWQTGQLANCWQHEPTNVRAASRVAALIGNSVPGKTERARTLDRVYVATRREALPLPTATVVVVVPPTSESRHRSDAQFRSPFFLCFFFFFFFFLFFFLFLFLLFLLLLLLLLLLLVNLATWKHTERTICWWRNRSSDRKSELVDCSFLALVGDERTIRAHCQR